MPFQFINVRTTFQKMINNVLHRIPFSKAYLDEIVVLEKSIHDQIQYLEMFFLLLGNHNLKLKLSKYEFDKSSVELLDNIAGSKEILVDSRKVSVKRDAAISQKATS